MYLNFLSAIHYFQGDAVPITLSGFISFLFTPKRTLPSPLFPPSPNPYRSSANNPTTSSPRYPNNHCMPSAVTTKRSISHIHHSLASCIGQLASGLRRRPFLSVNALTCRSLA
jgi:hypothetical protein